MHDLTLWVEAPDEVTAWARARDVLTAIHVDGETDVEKAPRKTHDAWLVHVTRKEPTP